MKLDSFCKDFGALVNAPTLCCGHVHRTPNLLFPVNTSVVLSVVEYEKTRTGLSRLILSFQGKLPAYFGLCDVVAIHAIQSNNSREN